LELDRWKHWKAVDEVLQRLSKAGLRLNKEKCVFSATSAQILGLLVDASGIKPTSEKE